MRKCNTENEPAWVEDIKGLFCSFNPLPKGGLTSGTRFNSLTRLVLYITILLYLGGFSKWFMFLMLASVMLVVLYVNYTRHQSKSKENFAILSSEASVSSSTGSSNMTSTPPPLIYDNSSNGLRKLFPQYEVSIGYQADQIRSPDADNQLRLMPLQTMNSSNSMHNYEDRAINTSKEPGHRDSQAGIQYFTPNVGVNRRVNIEPIIAPRPYDFEYWGRSQNVPKPAINRLQAVDITNEAINTYDMAAIPDRYPYAQGYKVGYPLGLPVEYVNRVPGGVWNMNPVGQDPDIGFYESSQNLYNEQNYYDFNRNVLPTYNNAKSYVAPVLDMQPTLNAPTQPLYKAWDAPITGALPPTQYIGVSQQQVSEQEGGSCTACSGGSNNNKKGVKEGFTFLEGFGGPNQAPPPSVPAQLNQYVAQPAEYPLTTQYTFNTPGGKQLLGGGYTEMGRVPPGQNAQIPAVTNQLMYQSPTYSYNSNYFNTPNEKLFLQTVQPSLFSYSVDQTPINSNIGIAYAPQLPPRVLDQVVNNGTAYPLYSRVDPQLVRTDGTPGQQASQPVRSDWSAEYSNFQPPKGSINFEDIYNPTFTSYGDPYRSYSDVNLGQVQYYYSDIEAYTMPNFIQRSNVDFVDFRTPNGQIWPDYKRNVSIDEVRAHVENQTTADDLYHREDLMSLQMDKANRINYQKRFAPTQKMRGGFAPI